MGEDRAEEVHQPGRLGPGAGEIVHEAAGGERLFAQTLNTRSYKIIIDPGATDFEISPHWSMVGGFDCGKANPTAALVGYVDFDGNIYLTGEYYQPGLSPKQHKPNLEQLNGFLRIPTVQADPSIFNQKNQAQSDGTFKALADLYFEEGVANISPAPARGELAGMERILEHWHDLVNREPTLKILCPRHKQDIVRPLNGVHNDGCPNLLWELRRARRGELSSSQLVSKNPTEKIVDRDNHLRDCLKYIVLSLPEPAKKTAMVRAQEAVQGLDPTSAMIRWQQVMAEAQNEEQPIAMGRRGAVIRGRNRKPTFL